MKTIKKILVSAILLFAGVSLAAAQMDTATFRAGKISLMYAQPIAKKLSISITDISKPNVDLSNKYNLPVRSQGGRKTCSVHTLAFLIEYAYAKSTNGARTPDLSEEYLNYVTNLAAQNQNDGDFFYNVNQGYQQYGQAFELNVPFQPVFDPSLKVDQKYMDSAKKFPRYKANFIKENANFTADKSDDANPFGLTDAQMNAITSELDGNRPVAVGMRWFKKGAFATETILGVELLKNVPADLTAGHSIALVGYRRFKGYPGGGYFIFRNSWGDSFGNKGYGYVSFEFVKTHAADAMSYR